MVGATKGTGNLGSEDVAANIGLGPQDEFSSHYLELLGNNAQTRH